jgi:hypothetical protein
MKLQARCLMEATHSHLDTNQMHHKDMDQDLDPTLFNSHSIKH